MSPRTGRVRADQRPGLVLQRVEYRARLMELLAEVRVTQIYANTEKTNIEAVFTFPLPLEATLLDLEVVLGERRLTGVVVERTEGQESYEDAVADGDTAVLLEQVAPGLFTLNAGNLLPGETARIAFRYAEVYSWQGDGFRFFLPLVVAPRYGDPEAAGLAPHQVPQPDLFAENACTIEVEACGSLARAEFVSPSHPIEVERGADAARIRVAQQTAWMDRDFIVNITSTQAEKTFAAREDEAEGAMLWVSFHPVWEDEEEAGPRSVKIVVDCSGSMAGDSIAQARQALERILDLLRPQDWFNLVRFGNDQRPLFRRQVEASPANLARARAVLAEVDADLGGTEIGAALQVAYSSRGPRDLPADVLLVTDGEAWDDGRVLAQAENSGHSVFAVGVGSAVSEAFLRQLAIRTGGACELVSPNEEMAERIVRHFRRIWAPRVETVSIRWPGEMSEQTPAQVQTVYRDETVHVFARCGRVDGDEVGLELCLKDGRRLSFQAAARPVPWPAGPLSLLGRLAAARRLREERIDAAQAVALAVRHQLVCAHTCMLVVAERAEGEKAEGLPALRQVRQMLAAGWGGTSTVGPAAVLRCSGTPPYPGIGAAHAPPLPQAFIEDAASLGIGGTGGRKRMELRPSGQVADLWGRFVAELCARLAQDGAAGLDLDGLAQMGLDEELVEWLRSLIDEYHPEGDLVAVFLFEVVSGLPAGRVNRDVVRRLRKESRRVTQAGGWAALQREMATRVSGGSRARA